TGYSPSLISDYNEYNAEVTILNDNNISCRYSKYENNCYKFAGPKKCSFTPATQDAFARIVCNPHECKMEYGNVSSSNAANIIPNISGSATIYCEGSDIYGLYHLYGPKSVNIGYSGVNASLFCSSALYSGQWKILNCKLSNGVSQSNSSPQESCRAEYKMKN
ncbi:hypothetical protein J6I39_07850, partial [bacterium]|nr:hypothetical protein [bacterium]